ncbi:hypothetical protein CEXT_157551 [Caerostris extrusa]|uniref:Uncharacterized protein n=1 Tax=Caerostris extrusa TaxID=172846 RepID=A0AAV4PA17_CAEEX|nr:hypothetical protein CEXT_157551 [Caerostris extrusa]
MTVSNRSNALVEKSLTKASLFHRKIPNPSSGSTISPDSETITPLPRPIHSSNLPSISVRIPQVMDHLMDRQDIRAALYFAIPECINGGAALVLSIWLQSCKWADTLERLDIGLKDLLIIIRSSRLI